MANDLEPFAGHWEGGITLPNGSLGVAVDLAAADSFLSGTIDIPAQGAEGLPLAGFEVDGRTIRFSIQNIPGNPTFDGALADGRIAGTFRQGGGAFPFELARAAAAVRTRPQEPVPPYPYDVEEVSYASGELTLAGTLTLPRGAERSPAAILISGSGAQDRDESLLGHRPFLVLADHLTRAGIAVLRVDDRGVGGSTGDLATSTSADFAGDVLAGIRFLSAHRRVDRARIGVIGHSEGALVGAMAAARSKDVAFVVMLAGPGVSGRELLPKQLERLGRAEGVPETVLEKQLQLQARVLELLASEHSTAEIEVRFREVVAEQVDLAGGVTGEQREQAIAQATRSTLTPWMRFFVTHDPRTDLARVAAPVLALNGELDTQVDAEQNLSAIEKALREAGNADVTAVRLPGLNHLFQSATTGAVSEYAQIDETMSPKALELVTSWILARAH